MNRKMNAIKKLKWNYTIKEILCFLDESVVLAINRLWIDTKRSHAINETT